MKKLTFFLFKDRLNVYDTSTDTFQMKHWSALKVFTNIKATNRNKHSHRHTHLITYTQDYT